MVVRKAKSLKSKDMQIPWESELTQAKGLVQ